VIVIFLFFRHGVVATAVTVFNWLVARRRAQPAVQPSGD
jgi:hypothetical protein